MRWKLGLLYAHGYLIEKKCVCFFDKSLKQYQVTNRKFTFELFCPMLSVYRRRIFQINMAHGVRGDN